MIAHATTPRNYQFNSEQMLDTAQFTFSSHFKKMTDFLYARCVRKRNNFWDFFVIKMS